MTDRERLGLPDRYMADRFAETYPAAFEALRGLSKASLLRKCQSKTLPLVKRLAAGNLLAIIGDPRVRTLSPVMVSVPSAVAKIGLEPDKVGQVLTNFADLGLDRTWIEKESPRHVVQLAGFSIGRYPVTNQEYRDFLIDSGFNALPDSWTFRRFPSDRANHPVFTVGPDAADAYCAWLSVKTGRAFRLPREAEWEYAASGPEGREFPWGETFDADLCNTCETGIFTTTPIGIFPEGESYFGISDMAGNVEEYVADPYQPYPGGVFVTDHLAQIHGEYRVARGGTFARFRDLARTRRRHGHNPRSSAYAMGFRLAETVG